MKKIVSFLMALVLIMGCFSVLVSATDETENIIYIDRIDVNIASDGSASVNDGVNYHISSDSPTKIIGGKHIDFTIEPNDGYKFSDDVKVYYSGSELYISNKNQEKIIVKEFLMNSSIWSIMYKIPFIYPYLILLNKTFYGYDAWLLTAMMVALSDGLFG